jgi:hypothetical protein
MEPTATARVHSWESGEWDECELSEEAMEFRLIYQGQQYTRHTTSSYVVGGCDPVTTKRAGIFSRP